MSAALTHWKGRPLAILSRDDLVSALSEVVAAKPGVLPPMVPGTVFAPMERAEVAPNAKPMRIKGAGGVG